MWPAASSTRNLSITAESPSVQGSRAVAIFFRRFMHMGCQLINVRRLASATFGSAIPW